MQISARNQIKGKVLSIDLGDIIAKVKVQIDPSTITSIITKEAAESLNIVKDDDVTIIVKATEVMIGK